MLSMRGIGWTSELNLIGSPYNMPQKGVSFIVFPILPHPALADASCAYLGACVRVTNFMDGLLRSRSPGQR